MREWFVKPVDPDQVDIELNAFSEQGWNLYKLFQEPGKWEGLVMYRGVWWKTKV